ncbi:MAG: fumarylacetoacetate hydrolase family protein [Oceanospirillaceae bacterium]|nr:fumarylacetoacetate hydrolase family protein [Oceanospirillaceae bacterium]
MSDSFINETAVESAARKLYVATEQRKPCSPVRDELPELDLDAAYAVQEINTIKALESGRRLVGRKIGLTSKVVQAQLGVDQPDFGMLFADMAIADGEMISMDRVQQPKIEAEVAFILSRDLLMDEPTTADVISAIDYVLPALEIVGSRIKDWDINIVDTIADNASSGLFVLGNQKRSLADFDSRLCGMSMEVQGEVVSTGAGAACLGNPINAVTWLAREMALRNRHLRAGDIILSGALGPMVKVEAGQTYTARISGLGSVRASFSAV